MLSVLVLVLVLINTGVISAGCWCCCGARGEVPASSMADDANKIDIGWVANARCVISNKRGNC